MEEKKDETQFFKIKKKPILKSANEIVRAASTGQIKILELSAYCEAAESNLREIENKIKILNLSKIENKKMMTQFVKRNKINAINSESLFQAKNQLYKYKCDLKADFCAIQGKIKVKKLKYSKLISYYESEWQKNLEAYLNDPLAKEALKVQEENEKLENDVDRLKQLTINSTNTLNDLNIKIEKQLYEKIIEFSEEMIQYANAIKREEEMRKAESEKTENNRGAKNVLTRSLIFPENLSATIKIDNDCYLFPPVDIQDLDDVVIPEENLENFDEDDLSLILNDAFPSDHHYNEGDREKSHGECSKSGSEITLLEKQSIEGDFDGVRKKRENPENFENSGNMTESQYFTSLEKKSHNNENLNISKAEWMYAEKENINPTKKRKVDSGKKFNKNSIRKETEKYLKTYLNTEEEEVEEKEEEEEVEEEIFKTNVEETDDSEFYYEKRMLIMQQKEKELGSKIKDTYDFHYPHRLSERSEEISLPETEEENQNRSLDSPMDTSSEQNIKNSEEKNNIQSFRGFFSTGDEKNSPNPSIFKLF